MQEFDAEVDKYRGQRQAHKRRQSQSPQQEDLLCTRPAAWRCMLLPVPAQLLHTQAYPSAGALSLSCGQQGL